MSRSIKKGPYIHPKLAKKVEAIQRLGTKTVIRTWSRASMIMPDMVGLTFGVHDAGMYRFLLRRIWSATGWASSPRRGPIAVTSRDPNAPVGQ